MKFLFIFCRLFFSFLLASSISSLCLADDKLDIGGAVWLNYEYKDYDKKQKDKLGKFDFSLFRIDVDAIKGDWYLDAQYRWYKSFGYDTLHHAFIGFNIDQNNQVEFGIHQVPFGMEGVASNSFWLSGAYYLGYEDDYDAGIKWQHKGEGFRVETALYLSSELNHSDYTRYSFDVSSEKGANYFGSGGSAENEESGQLNLRYVADLSQNTTLGVSLEYGRIYNNANEESANHKAYAVHANHSIGLWNFQLELIEYTYDEDESIGTDDGTIAMSAFDYASDIAAKGRVAIVNFSREFTPNNRFVKTAKCYSDFTHIEGKSKPIGDDESLQNVTGCVLANGSIYTYIDIISAKNMYFVRGKGVGVRDNVGWNTRLNINIGWYF